MADAMEKKQKDMMDIKRKKAELEERSMRLYGKTFYWEKAQTAFGPGSSATK